MDDLDHANQSTNERNINKRNKTTTEIVEAEEEQEEEEEAPKPKVNAHAAAAARAAAAQAQRDQANSAASKGKKAFEGMGLTEVRDINRVAFKRPRGELIVINEPEVYRVPGTDTYIIHGVPQMQKSQLPGLGRGGLSQANALQQQLLRAGSNPAALAQMLQAAAGGAAGGAAAAAPHVHGDDCDHDQDEAEAEDDAPVPEGLTEKEIQMVMKQGAVGRGAAISAIKANEGDVAAAIMQLTDDDLE
ncbi:hypothetical protein BC828DRAFT_394443 [Blastocladiella britannica]|nr:hypothetical protein BC828DRAFT_394443 [Blastocladiella britannica]